MSNTNRFETFLSELKPTNAGLDFYSDFEKIDKKVAEITFSLNTLNFLVGKQNIDEAVDIIWKRDKQAFGVMDILIATREKDYKLYLDKYNQAHLIHSMFESPDGVKEFLHKTGLAELLTQKKITNLHDYVFGVETGLDSNTRKNRSGKIMEKLVRDILKESNIHFREQVSSREFAAIEQILGVDQKVFDFAIFTPSKTYLIEVNFYSGGGSKLNETARSYTDIAPKVNSVNGFEFIWITDGQGWLSAKNKLQEAFSAIPGIYNLTTIFKLIQRIQQELS